MWADLVCANLDLHGDLVRNVPGMRESQHPFDDLSPDPADWDIASAAEGGERATTGAELLARPFDHGSVISYTFDSAHWQATRFSDGSRYGVWYGSFDIETTVYETAWRWYRFVLDSFPAEPRDIVTERQVFDVRCDALLVDLRGKEAAYPGLTSRSSYVFTQQLGRYACEQGVNGLVVASARCSGANVAVFKPERLSNVRHRSFLTYRLSLARDMLVAERTPGRAWMRLRPSTVA